MCESLREALRLFLRHLNELIVCSCGTWPAFWLVGSGVWPATGEMDIIEQTNNQPQNIMSLHSSAEPNCSIAGTGLSGKLLTNDCAVSMMKENNKPLFWR